MRHHDQTPSVQASFTEDVRSLVKVMEELGNPFEEDSMSKEKQKLTCLKNNAELFSTALHQLSDEGWTPGRVLSP